MVYLRRNAVGSNIKDRYFVEFQNSEEGVTSQKGCPIHKIINWDQEETHPLNNQINYYFLQQQFGLSFLLFLLLSSPRPNKLTSNHLLQINVFSALACNKSTYTNIYFPKKYVYEKLYLNLSSSFAYSHSHLFCFLTYFRRPCYLL